MDLILLIIGIILIAVGRKQKTREGKINKKGIALCSFGIICLLPFTIIFVQNFIKGFGEGFTRGFDSAIEKYKTSK